MARSSTRKARSAPGLPRYRPPEETLTIPLSDALQRSGRASLDERQLDMLRHGAPDGRVMLHYAGDIGLLELPAVSIVGTREVSDGGRRRAMQLARDLADAGILVVSGLARGVDAAGTPVPFNMEGLPLPSLALHCLKPTRPKMLPSKRKSIRVTCSCRLLRKALRSSRGISRPEIA